MKQTTRTQEDLEPIVQDSISFAEVIRKLGLKQTGSNQSHLKKRIIQLGIDYSHFTGQGWNRRKPARNRNHWSDILILRDPAFKREKAIRLRRAMIESGIIHICHDCGNTGIWNNYHIVLEIHHMNGMFWDNRKENLVFLCPNCHSQK